MPSSNITGRALHSMRMNVLIIVFDLLNRHQKTKESVFQALNKMRGGRSSSKSAKPSKRGAKKSLLNTASDTVKTFPPLLPLFPIGSP